MSLNSDKPWPSLAEARQRVLGIQRKLHRWSKEAREKRFCDLYNLVHDRATLLVAWQRIQSNRGSKTAGIDGYTRHRVEHGPGAEAFLEEIRLALKGRTYRPLPTRERLIPKGPGKTRPLGIPALRDRVVQMALKLVLEPIFEVDFCPTSYGYRPARRAQDAITEIVGFINPPGGYDYVVEGDIEGCFENVHHGILMRLVRQRIGDRRVLRLIKAFLGAGVVRENGRFEATLTGTPQGGILSPILANIYLSVLDQHFERAWKEQSRYHGRPSYLHKKGIPVYRLVRYADDFVILVRGTRRQAAGVRNEAARLLRGELRMKLSKEKTSITHVDEGFDFLGHHIRRVPWRGHRVAWTFPSKKSLKAIQRKIKSLTRRKTTWLTLEQILRLVNRVLRGWAMYFRFDAAKRTFDYLDHFTWWRLFRWCRKKHPTRRNRWLRNRYRGGGWVFRDGEIELFRAATVKVERYRYRGRKILLPWMDPDELGPVGRYAACDVHEPVRLAQLQLALGFPSPTSLVESRMRGNAHVRFGGRSEETESA